MASRHLRFTTSAMTMWPRNAVERYARSVPSSHSCVHAHRVHQLFVAHRHPVPSDLRHDAMARLFLRHAARVDRA